MVFRSFVITIIFIFLSGSLATGIEQRQQDVSDLYFARYCISQGKYLIEVGKYLEAVEYFDTAIETTDAKPVLADALLQKATVLATYLDKPNEAIEILKKIVLEFPQTRQAESALYKMGLMYLDASMPDEAVKFFRAYLQRYPQGRFWRTAVFFVNKYSKRLAPLPTPPSRPQQPGPPPDVKPPAETPPPWLKAPQTKTIQLPPVKITGAPEMRVRVFKGKRARLKGSLQVQAGPQKFSSGYIELFQSGGQLYISGYPAALKEVVIKPMAGVVYIQKSGKWKGYRGYMKARIYKGNLIVVNYLNIQEYLYSVVTSESYPGWPIEALKAQAVAARTYALYQSLHRKNWPFDVVDNEGDQAYKGISAEHKKGIAAVQATSGMVLTWQGRPILAMYTASTGWYVDDPQYIFGFGYPYLQLKKDPYSEREKMGRWKKEISIYALERGLRKRGLDVYGIYDIVPVKQSPSGRIIKARILHQRGQRVVRVYTTIRKVANLPDILMTIRREGDRFVFYGGGYGHGIGYSQWGGKEMAEQGNTYQQILAFYYPGATIQKLW
jgi:stage II sporulation protein D